MSLTANDGRESQKQYYFPTAKNYNVMIDAKNFFDHSLKSDLKTYDDIRKIATGQGDDYTIGCLLDYPYFKKYYQLIAIDLSKQQKLVADPKAIQQINFNGNLSRKKRCNNDSKVTEYYDFISYQYNVKSLNIAL